MIDYKIRKPIDRRVTKSNKLINAREKKALSAIEQKVLLNCILNIDGESFDKRIQIRIQDIFNTKNLGARDYTALRKACSNLSSTTIAFEEFGENNEFIRGRWMPIFSDIEAEIKTGICSFKFNSIVKEHIVNLKNNFTSYNYEHIRHLNSGFSIRIYELLMQGRNKYRQRIFSIEELLDKLAITNSSSYHKFSNIKKNILDKSAKELSEKTDIEVHWEVVQKQGRKITHILFVWDYKKMIEAPLEGRQLIEKQKYPPIPEEWKQEPITALSVPDFSEDEILKMETMKNLGMNQEVIIGAMMAERAQNRKSIPLVTKISDLDDKKKRLFKRLTEQGVLEEIAHKIVESTQARKESGVWVELNNLKMKIKDGVVSNPTGYLMAMAKQKNWI